MLHYATECYHCMWWTTPNRMDARVARAQAARRCVARANDGSGIDVTDLGDGTYDVDIEKPVPIKFCRGNDGGCYIKVRHV